MPIETALLALVSDTDNRASTEAALELAGQTNATVVIGAAYDEAEHTSAIDEMDISSPTDLAQRDQELEAVVSRFEEAGIPHEVRGSVGVEGGGHVSLAEEVDADRVFVQERKRSPAGKAVFGSVAQHVLLNAPCPVTFVRE